MVRDQKIVIADHDLDSPQPNQTVVQVVASSINQGEVRAIRSVPHWQLTAGESRTWVPGWDFAGLVVAAAADGRGPPVGARVAGWVRQGAWAERVLVPVDQLVVLPTGVAFDASATLPIAGLTAWHALRVGGLQAGKSVLVTGAAGGVGRFALQIARAAGARAIAMVSNDDRARSVAHLADEVVIDLPAAGRYDVILDCIGGSALATMLGLLAPYGAVVCYGNSSNELTAFDAGPAFRKPCISIHSFALYDELERRTSNVEGLPELLALLESGKIVPEIALRVGIHDLAAACDALMSRTVNGKIVLEVAPNAPTETL